MSESPSPVDIRAVWRRRRRWFVLPCLLVALAAAMIAFSLPSVYRASATFIVDLDALGRDWARTGYPTVVEMVVENLSRQVLTAENLVPLVKQHHLYPDRSLNAAVTRLRKDVSVKMITTDVINPRSGLPGLATVGFGLTVQGSDPEDAHAVLQEIVARYLEPGRNTLHHEAGITGISTAAELKASKALLDDLEMRLTNFRENHASCLPETIPINRQIVLGLEQQIRSFGQDSQRASARRLALRTEADPRSRELERLRNELAAKRSILSPKHPDIIALNEAVTSLERQIRSRSRAALPPAVRSELAALDKQIRRLNSDRQAAREKITLAMENIEQAGQLEGEYQTLTRDFELAQVHYHKVMARDLEQRALHHSPAPGLFSLVEAPQLPANPAGPPRLMILLIGLFIAPGVGLLMLVSREVTDRRLWSSAQLEETLPVLTAVPEIKGLAKGMTDAALNGGPAVDRAFARLKARLLDDTVSGRAVLVSSAHDGEGKSLVCARLARALAQESRSPVLLVDADLTSSTLHTLFGAEVSRGLSDHLQHGVPLPELIVSTDTRGLSLLPAGIPLPESAAQMRPLAGLIPALKARFPQHTLVIDAPAPAVDPGTLVLSAHVDGVVFVVQARRTLTDEVRDALHALGSTPVFGAVLNRAP